MTAQQKYDLYVKSLELAAMATQGNRNPGESTAECVLRTSKVIRVELEKEFLTMEKVTG